MSGSNPRLAEKRQLALQFTVSPEQIEEDLESWVLSVFESNDELALVLKRLRRAYNAVRAGNTDRNGDKILAQVKAALHRAENAKKVI